MVADKIDQINVLVGYIESSSPFNRIDQEPFFVAKEKDSLIRIRRFVPVPILKVIQLTLMLEEQSDNEGNEFSQMNCQKLMLALWREQHYKKRFIQRTRRTRIKVSKKPE